MNTHALLSIFTRFKTRLGICLTEPAAGNRASNKLGALGFFRYSFYTVWTLIWTASAWYPSTHHVLLQDSLDGGRVSREPLLH